MSITGKYTVSLSLPGGKRDCVLDLREEAGAITGTVSNPYTSDQQLEIYDGAVSGEGLSFKTMVGRTEYTFSGQLSDLTLTTNETIVLDPGKRIAGQSGEVAGEYLVGVYSPGGVKENHMVIEEKDGGLGGEMFGLVTEESMAQMAQMMGAAPGQQAAPSGIGLAGKDDSPHFAPQNRPNPAGGPGGPGGMPPMPPMKIGDRTDVNVFTAGSKNGSDFELQTVTAQGSLFRFVGSVAGDTICITMHVTDVTEGLKAVKN